MEEETRPAEQSQDAGIRRLEEAAQWLHRQELGMVEPATIFLAEVGPEP